MSSTITDTVIYYLHCSEGRGRYRVRFFRTPEERNSEADKARFAGIARGLEIPEIGEICLYRAIEWHENERCPNCLIDDPRLLFPKWYPVRELEYA